MVQLLTALITSHTIRKYILDVVSNWPSFPEWSIKRKSNEVRPTRPLIARSKYRQIIWWKYKLLYEKKTSSEKKETLFGSSRSPIALLLPEEPCHRLRRCNIYSSPVRKKRWQHHFSSRRPQTCVHYPLTKFLGLIFNQISSQPSLWQCCSQNCFNLFFMEKNKCGKKTAAFKERNKLKFHRWRVSWLFANPQRHSYELEWDFWPDLWLFFFFFPKDIKLFS